MNYLSKTNRHVTEKYIEFFKQGIPNSKILPHNECIQATDADSISLFGILRGTNLVYEHCQKNKICLLYTSPSPRDATLSRMPSSA